MSLFSFKDCEPEFLASTHRQIKKASSNLLPCDIVVDKYLDDDLETAIDVGHDS